MPAVSLAAATAEVARRDPALRRVIERAGPCSLRSRRSENDHFESLVEAIAYQQLAGAAAAAIYGRFRALVPGDLTPAAVLALPEEAMRGAGLSGAKTASIRDLATKVADGGVPLDGIRRLRDEEIVRMLTMVRGIGRWTAEMFLIFRLRRLDVWPVDDLGVRTGYAIAHGIGPSPTARALEPLGETYRPYRTVAAWYCWQAVRLDRGDPLR